jgi:hypothetical protein
MNEETHWDGIAENYSKEIFDVFKSDRNKLLPMTGGSGAEDYPVMSSIL